MNNKLKLGSLELREELVDCGLFEKKSFLVRSEGHI